MASTRQIKRRIGTSANISKITKAMEMVSASKMRRAQQKAVSSRPYTHEIQASLQRVAQRIDPMMHPLLSQHHDGFDVLILFSTDRGLCGGLNTNLFKNAWSWGKSHKEMKVVTIGKKAVAFARKMGLPIEAQFTDLPETVSLADILPISTLVIQGFLKHEFRSVFMLHMDFINTLSQKVKLTRLLPLSSEVTKAEQGTVHPEVHSEYLFEPDASSILDELLPYYIENTIYQTILEAKASEHSARMVAMKNASDNAKELVGELKLIFNKSRQAAITSEILDITTATLTVHT